MYAVVSSGGKQYRVEPGSTLTMERLAAEAGSTLTFDRVLLIGDGDEVTVGTPVVSGASVSATVLGEELGPKLVIFKFKQKVKYRRRTGHRQHLVRVRIDAITADGKSTRAPEAEARPKGEAKPKAEAKATTLKADARAKAAAAPRPRAPRKAEAEAKAEAVEGEAAPAAPKRRASRAKPVELKEKESEDSGTEKATPAKRAPATRRAAKPKAEE